MNQRERKGYLRLTVLAVLLALFIIVLSGLLSRETRAVELYTYMNETGGGAAVAFVDVKEGFPINYIDNTEGILLYSPSWERFALNSIFWLCFVAVFVTLGHIKSK